MCVQCVQAMQQELIRLQGEEGSGVLADEVTAVLNVMTHDDESYVLVMQMMSVYLAMFPFVLVQLMASVAAHLAGHGGGEPVRVDQMLHNFQPKASH